MERERESALSEEDEESDFFSGGASTHHQQSQGLRHSNSHAPRLIVLPCNNKPPPSRADSTTPTAEVFPPIFSKVEGTFLPPT